MRAIWIDTDLALGAAHGDVDDGFALAAVLRAARRAPQRFRVLGVSAVAGNTDAGTALGCIQRLIAAAGCADLPVRAAADAPAAIAALPAGASVLALGPLTNIAAALALDPALARRIELRTVGGVLDAWRHPLLRFYCLNFRTDPGAARRVVAAPFAPPHGRRRGFPLDVVKRLAFGRTELERIAATGPLGDYLSRHSWRWLRQSSWRYASSRFAVWDLVAALDAVQALAAPRHDRDGARLVSFDAAASFERFVELLEEAAEGAAEALA